MYAARLEPFALFIPSLCEFKSLLQKPGALFSARLSMFLGYFMVLEKLLRCFKESFMLFCYNGIIYTIVFKMLFMILIFLFIISFISYFISLVSFK